MSAPRNYPESVPAEQQKQDGKGTEAKMSLEPMYSLPNHKGSEQLKDLVALITGGDSGIGRSVAILYVTQTLLLLILNPNPSLGSRRGQCCHFL